MRLARLIPNVKLMLLMLENIGAANINLDLASNFTGAGREDCSVLEEDRAGGRVELRLERTVSQPDYPSRAVAARLLKPTHFPETMTGVQRCTHEIRSLPDARAFGRLSTRTAPIKITPGTS